MRDTLKILQLNIYKSRACMEALINDNATADLDILLIQEPPISFFKSIVQHRQWQAYMPTHDGPERKRAILYVNKRIDTSLFQQIKCSSPDVAAIQIQTPQGPLDIYSAYVPPIGGTGHVAEQEMQATLQAIQSTYVSHSTGSNSDMILCGDLNRQDPLWGGDHIQPYRVGSAASLLLFMQDRGLQSHLKRGTPTCWSTTRQGSKTTLDLVLSNIPSRLYRCSLYHDNYGSDHRAIFAEWSISLPRKEERPARRMYERTD